jgi:hypothetical protein
MLEAIHDFGMELLVVCLYLQVLEGEIAETIYLVLFLSIEESLALTFAVAHHDMVGIGEGRVLSALEVVELLPRSYEKEILHRSLDILDGDVFVALRRIRAHFQP